MHRAKTLFIIAILLMVVPHLGLTNLMEQITLFVLGLVVLIFSYGLYFENKNKKEKPTANINNNLSKKRYRSTPIPHPHPLTLKKEIIEEGSDVIVIQKESENMTDNNFNI
jgi:hypothetical protein